MKHLLITLQIIFYPIMANAQMYPYGESQEQVAQRQLHQQDQQLQQQWEQQRQTQIMQQQLELQMQQQQEERLRTWNKGLDDNKY